MNPAEAFDAGIPAFGTWVLYAFIVAASAAFALALRTATTPDRARVPALLRASRMVALGACSLVVLDVLLLLYAFVSHDFRVRYVMRYSDRSMPSVYLVTALWGGQDGSLLWWTFLLSLYTAACVVWLRDKHRELAPWVIVTLMGVLGFFGVLMAFSANPFAANVAGAPPDGEGLNPSLQNFYMAIHPPSLYTGFTGCAIPFAFAMAALLSGRLDDEWIKATRKWALFAWLFLSVGNVLGMLWAYEELGWGGYWAWDPVENAACIPWFTLTAYLHSSMIQERRGSLKIWNVSLVLLTFLLTIFGTFLTRSGLIASIHSFAQSGIGTYFVWYMCALIAIGVSLVLYRLPKLKSATEIDSLLSREAMFVANNWLLLGVCTFIVLATTWPKVSEWLWKEKLTVGASFYNAWLTIPGLTLLALVGIGTLTPWRKGTGRLVWEAFRVPLAAGTLVGLAHALFGARLGYPAVVSFDAIYPSAVGRGLAHVNGSIPAVSIALVAFNVTAVAQEFWRGARSRMRARGEAFVVALVRVVARNRRRYGGYLVHVGIALMFLGFTGNAWKVEAEASVEPGQSFTVGRYTLRYDGVSSRRDPAKREILARITVLQDGHAYTTVAPAKFVYTARPDMPTSEVSITTSLRDDLYVVMASVDPTTRVAHLKAFVNPLTAWIWLGALVLILGTATAMWPEISLATVRASLGDAPLASPARRAMLLAVGALGGALVLASRPALAQHTTGSPPPVSGDIETLTPSEHRLFDRLLCMCGGCQRLPLGTCTCDLAARLRANMRARLHDGETADSLVAEYVARYGAMALSVPPDAGHNRAVYALPAVAVSAGGVAGAMLVRSWRARSRGAGAPVEVTDAATRAVYDKRLDEELRGLDE